MIDEIKKDFLAFEKLGQRKVETDDSYNLIKKIHNRLHKKEKSMIIVIVGEPGSGKSWAALRLAELIDPNFNADQVAFYKSQFMGLMKETDKYPPGSAFVFDDAGVEYSNRKFHDNLNINFLLQTIRYRRFAFIITVPIFDFIDKQGRMLCQAKFRMMDVDRKHRISTMIPYVQSNDGFGFTKTGFPLLNGMLISEVKVKVPSCRLRKDYEAKAKEFKDQIGIRNYAIEKVKEDMRTRLAVASKQELTGNIKVMMEDAPKPEPLIPLKSSKRLRYDPEKDELVPI